MLMTWTTPTLVEICFGLEIDGYLPAEFWPVRRPFDAVESETWARRNAVRR